MAFTEKYVSSLAGGSGTGTIGSPYTWAQMIALIGGATSQASVRFNIKADGTYSRSAGEDFASGLGGAQSGPCVMRGYKTTPGDGYLGRDSNGILITTNMPLIVYGPSDCWFKPPQFCVIESLHFQGHAGGEFVTIQSNSVIVGCRVNFDGTNGAGACARLGNDVVLAFECDFDVTVSGSSFFVAVTSAGGGRIDSCRFTTVSPACGGFRPDQFVAIYGCFFKGAGGSAGIYYNDPNRQTFVRNCTITNWGSGIKIETATQRPQLICGNLITDCTAYGIELTSVSWCGLIGPNRIRDCALGVTDSVGSNGDWANAGRIIPLNTTDTGGPETDYVNAATGNYTLIATSPAHNANYPKNSDLGCYGAADPAGGGGTAVHHPLKPFIIRSV